MSASISSHALLPEVFKSSVVAEENAGAARWPVS
jgi:hypothetical protein